MMKNSSFAFKLILFIGVSGMVILAVIFGYNYLVTGNIILRNLEENAQNLALSTVNRIDAVLNPVEKIPESLAYFLEIADPDEKDLLRHLKATIENNSVIYGGTVAFEPNAFNRDSLYYAPYYYKDSDEMKLTWLGGETYRYFYWDWYQVPAELKRPIWSEPYYDEGGGEILMSTYSVPFYSTVSGERKFMGIVTADISLAWLQEFVDQIEILQSGYGFLISKFGTVVTHPDQSKIMNETIFSMAEARDDSGLRNIGRRMIKGKSGFVQTSSLTDGKKSYMYYAPMRSSGWSLGVLFPEDELMADAKRLSKNLFLLGLIGLALLVIAVSLIANSITKPLRSLVQASERVAQGDLDVKLPPVKYHDEIGRMSDSFSNMLRSLKDYIEIYAETAAAKERMESELKVAHNIQLSIIPRTFPPFPNRQEIDIYADLNPAKEVGGDYYDFFLIDDNHLCFTIGDVSGKGVPASLYMAVTRTLIRAKTVHGLSPAKVITRVNHDLCLDDSTAMFVTIFLGILDLRTGEIEYCNAGHDLPFLIRREGEVEPMGNPEGLVVGIFEDFEYKTSRFLLSQGDTVFLFTDGVTEAMNKDQVMYSEDRLEEFLKKQHNSNPTELINKLIEEVESFSAGAEQSDDITILALKYNGVSKMQVD